ncbi:hypothetical protein PVAND_003748 [Polypedilum vanderplanki]|uniref:ADP-ribosylation factor-like protein 3 n=1 Tax=Polypedilum vanderplanki TaxID=319348 RepID=A0A9J6BVI8_POLVA|nr:hypothetical protein PVAND_003748 [Polypedilum vanderplanki]
MGLLSLLRKLRSSSERDLRIVLVGLDNSGKTTILRQFANEETPQVTTPTAGFNIKSIQSNNLNLNVWDLGGNSKIRPYWKNYFENTDVLIFVVDSSDRKRMAESTSEFNELLKDEKLQNVPIIVLANKQDLNSSMKASEVAEIIGLVKLKDREWQIQACSAIDGTGLKEAMDWICKCMKK